MTICCRQDQVNGHFCLVQSYYSMYRGKWGVKVSFSFLCRIWYWRLTGGMEMVKKIRLKSPPEEVNPHVTDPYVYVINAVRLCI